MCSGKSPETQLNINLFKTSDQESDANKDILKTIINSKKYLNESCVLSPKTQPSFKYFVFFYITFEKFSKSSDLLGMSCMIRLNDVNTAPQVETVRQLAAPHSSQKVKF